MSWFSKFDRKLRKFLYGVEELPKLPLRGRIVNFIGVVLLLGTMGFYGYTFGFWSGTGTMPFGPKAISILPPEMKATVTSAEAEQAVKDSLLDLAPYGERNNCVELALVAARQLWWDGYQGTVIKIDFGDGTGHMIVGVPTSDEGWKFLNPQGNVWVSPRVGGMWMEKKIVGLYYLYDFVWKPIEEAQR